MGHGIEELPQMANKPFVYQHPFPLGDDKTAYRKVEGSDKYVSVASFEGNEILKVDPEALTIVANEAMRDVSFLLRPEHNESVGRILRDPESSQNDKGVAVAFLRNAEISAQFELPICQDTGTATIIAKKGQQVTDACKKYGGYYLGSIGGPAAVLAEENIKKVECIDFPELGMEAVWKIEVENFPAFILVDDKGNDFFEKLGL